MKDKFCDPAITADGSQRAVVDFSRLSTLWVNTGTRCNIECANCYIESSPTNDRLVYLRNEELTPFLAEAKQMGAEEIGFTGGEPFMNPDMLKMAHASLSAGFRVLILTNAMRPMMRPAIKQGLAALRDEFGDLLSLRVSLDHFTRTIHDAERGEGSFDLACEGLRWLERENFSISIAARAAMADGMDGAQAGFAVLFKELGLNLDADNAHDLVLFPEMDEAAPVPEITTDCWEVLDIDPRQIMCSDARMLVKRKGADKPTVLACTLLAYDEEFELGKTLKEAARPVSLNHPHCAKFCVLGGASCSA